MCLARTTKGPREATEWSVAYKALYEVEEGRFITPLYWLNTDPIRRGEVVKNNEPAPIYLSSSDDDKYPGGFHCFRRKKDAEEWRKFPFLPYTEVHRVFVRHIVATGRDSENRPVIVVEELYIPVKRGNKPPCALP